MSRPRFRVVTGDGTPPSPPASRKASMELAQWLSSRERQPVCVVATNDEQTPKACFLAGSRQRARSRSSSTDVVTPAAPEDGS